MAARRNSWYNVGMAKAEMFGGKRNKGGKKGKSSPPQILRDLRAVSVQSAAEDKGPMQKAMRKLFDESPLQFMDRLAKAEASHQQNNKMVEASRAARPEKVVRDAGTEKCIEAAERLLRELAK